MDRLIHEYRGTRVVQVDDQTLRFEARGTLGTALLLLITAGTVVANAYLLIPAALEGREVDRFLLAPWLMATACGVLAALLVRRRARSMGVVVIDGGARMIRRSQESWLLEAVERVSLPMDPMVRKHAPVPTYWICLHLPFGRRLLLCRALAPDLEPILERLRGMGIRT